MICFINLERISRLNNFEKISIVEQPGGLQPEQLNGTPDQLKDELLEELRDSQCELGLAYGRLIVDPNPKNEVEFEKVEEKAVQALNACRLKPKHVKLTSDEIQRAIDLGRSRAEKTESV